MNLFSSGIFGFDGGSLNPLLSKLIEKDAAGFILFKRNYQSLDQVRVLNSEILQKAGRNLILSVDQEGGRVRRLPAPFYPMPSMKKLLEQTEDLQVIEELHLRHGRLLRMMGFNLVYAPVVDVLDCFENQVIGDRSFSEDPERVVYFAKAVLCGLKESGILSCMKHFPGHGHTQVDSHLESVFSERSYEEIWEKDLLPYRELFSDSIMTAHIIFKGCAGVYPATFSTFWLERVLRKKIESKASLISDDLHMQAAVNTYPDSRERILESLEAGNDYYLWCKTKEDDLFLFEREYNLPEYPLSPAEPLSYSKSEWDDHHSFFSSVFSD